MLSSRSSIASIKEPPTPVEPAAAAVLKPESQNTSSTGASQSFWTSLWAGLCAFASALLGRSSRNAANASACPRGPTEPQNALQKPAGRSAAKGNHSLLKRSGPGANDPDPTASLKCYERTFSKVRCGAVDYKITWLPWDGKAYNVDFAAPTDVAYNRALFVAHTKKVLTCGGMQAVQPHLHAAAELWGTSIRIWTREAHSKSPWELRETAAPQDTSIEKTVDLCLSLKAGDQSHYRVLQNAKIVHLSAGETLALDGEEIETGSENECFYFAMAWALDRDGARQMRRDFEALPAKQKGPSKYVAYVNNKSTLLADMHQELGDALEQPQYAAAIDAEVMDAIMVCHSQQRAFRDAARRSLGQ